MNVLKLHHVQIMIPRGCEDEARDFYCGILGLPEVAKPEELKNSGGFWLELNGAQIHVGVGDSTTAPDSREHIAFQVSDLDVWFDKLDTDSARVKNGRAIPGFRRIEFRDPFNNRIEFLESTDELR